MSLSFISCFIRFQISVLLSMFLLRYIGRHDTARGDSKTKCIICYNSLGEYFTFVWKLKKLNLAYSVLLINQHGTSYRSRRRKYSPCQINTDIHCIIRDCSEDQLILLKYYCYPKFSDKFMAYVSLPKCFKVPLHNIDIKKWISFDYS